MSKNKIGEDSPIPKFIYLKIRRRDGVESTTTLEEGEFKVPIDGCIRKGWLTAQTGKNEKEYSWHVTAIKFIGVKQLVYKVANIL